MNGYAQINGFAKADGKLPPVAVNRVGHEGASDSGLEFWGGSFVAGPFGEVLAQAPHDREQNLIVECDFGQAEEVRRNWPFLRDRRIDAYDGMTKRFLNG